MQFFCDAATTVIIQVADNHKQLKFTKSNYHTIIRVIVIPEKCKSGAFIQTTEYKSKPSIITMVDNEIMNMDHDMLIDIVLWVNQPSKQVQVRLSNQTYRAATQHLE